VAVDPGTRTRRATTIGSRPKRPSKRRAVSAFINIPYDDRFENLYLAFIAGLSGFGLIPRATVEIPGSDRRLERIMDLIKGCAFSFHDLSRIDLDKRSPRTPRFNMPFELGLAVANTKKVRGAHRWFVFEEKANRLKKSLSDLDGTDPYIHDGKPDGVLRSLANALSRTNQAPT